MFNRFESALRLTALFLILSLFAWLWVQSNKIDSLKAENQLQAQTILSQQEANKKLAADLEMEREAARMQTEAENEQREKTNESVKVIYRTLSGDNCSKRSLPGGVIKQLQ